MEDPVFDSTLPWASPPSPGPSSSQDDQNPMHIFDIRRSNSVTELWKRYERSNRFPEQSSSQETSLEDVSESKPSKPVFGDASTVDIRQRWLRACNPPQVPKREPSPRKQQEQAPLSSFSSAQVSDAASSSMPANTDYTGEKVASQESGTSFLTAEGKRQVSYRVARNSKEHMLIQSRHKRQAHVCVAGGRLLMLAPRDLSLYLLSKVILGCLEPL